MNALTDHKFADTALHSRYLAQTHEVVNVSTELADYNMYQQDQALQEAVAREGAAWAQDELVRFGALTGSAAYLEQGTLANKHLPEFDTHDRFGNRIDWVEFHPAWHTLMELAWRHEVPSLAWTASEPQPHLARAVLSYLWNQVEHGTGCPTGMAYASVAGFEREPALQIWAQKVRAPHYEFSRREVGDKPGVVVGYAMTEKQGGSDLRETQTTAVFSHTADYHGALAHWYEITGHKWFCSVPQSDGFFALAKVAGGVTCFFLPRTLPDGQFNRFFIQRLKDKLGNRSNASSEVEYEDTLVHRVGDEGRGVATIIEMVSHTRLDCVVGSTAIMRQAVTQAGWHVAHREAFGSKLIDKPLMQNVLADLEIEVEVATLMMMRLSGAFANAGCLFRALEK